MHDRAKIIYGIGPYAKRRKTSLKGLFFIFFGLLVSLIGFYDIIQSQDFGRFLQIIFPAIGVFYIFFGANYWVLAKKTGITG